MNDLLSRNVFLRILFVATVYFILAVSSLQFSFHSSNASPVWPASGFAFAMLILWGRKIIPGVFLGAFVANIYVFLSNQSAGTATSVLVSLLIGIGNALEAMTGYYLLNKLIPSIRTEEIFRKVHHVNRFVLAALLMCLTSCTIGATSIFLGGIISLTELFTVWFTWWTGDVSGILLVTPLILLFSAGKFRYSVTGNLRILESLLLTLAIIITSFTVFANFIDIGFVFTRAFIITPFLIWATIRVDQRLVAALVIISAGIAIQGSLNNAGPFIGPTLNESLLTVEAFISINAVMVLLLSAAISERKEKESSLNDARSNLEAMVTERTKELNENNEQLRRQNNELTLFSYAVSHDLQEPLRKIEFFSGKILEDEKALSEKGKDYFQRTRMTAIRMKQLIENLLSFSIIDGNKKPAEKTNLNLVVQQVLTDLEESITQAGDSIDIAPLPEVKGIPSQLHQLFENIISNSIKFRKKDAPLQISIQYEKIDGVRIEKLGGAAGQEYHHLSFTDNGIGFDPEYADKIFDLLQKLHGRNEYEGTGIGLAICKKVVENHKGFIHAEGEPDKGCAMHIYLPVESVKVAGDEVKGKQLQGTYF